MLSKAIPKAYLRKYQRPMFQIQGVLSSGNGSPPPLSPVIPPTENYLDVS